MDINKSIISYTNNWTIYIICCGTIYFTFRFSNITQIKDAQLAFLLAHLSEQGKIPLSNKPCYFQFFNLVFVTSAQLYVQRNYFSTFEYSFHNQ